MDILVLIVVNNNKNNFQLVLLKYVSYEFTSSVRMAYECFKVHPG